MTETLTRAPVRGVATIDRGPYGLWFVRSTGNGYPTEHILSDTGKDREYLDALVEDGFEIVDPLHYCELYDIFRDEYMDVAEMDADSAGYPGYGARIGSTPGDNGRGLSDEELVF